MNANNKALPAKESAVFKSILKFYEHKQYKKGLKGAESILKKFPNHGETLAMKGLFYSTLDRKEEALEFIKKGIMSNMTSHICWHVYGLFHRTEKNYEEAVKCYTHALKYDKDNIQIMRDHALLHVHMRNYEAFNEARHQLLNARPAMRPNWMGLAISYHLLENYDAAEKVMNSYMGELHGKTASAADEPTGPLAGYEISEMLLYKGMIIEESGDYARALDHLQSIRNKVYDKTSWRSAKARLLIKSGKLAEAEVEYQRLLADNADSLEYVQGIRTARGLDGDNLDAAQTARLQRLFKELGAKYPRSHVIQRLPLTFASGDDFAVALDAYLRPIFRKGVPSLFVSSKDLLAKADKEAVIESVVLGYYNSLKAGLKFAPEDDAKEPPSVFLWVMFFLAQFYDRKRDSSRALEFINEAIAHSPTVVDLLMVKARIYKHAGDRATAMKVMNEARLLDLQDRYVNTKCTKYMLGNNAIKEAEETISLFTKSDDTDPDPIRTLVDLQCMWFEQASADAYVRMGNYGRALKRYHQIERHFVDIYDDQFDFHTYCLRKPGLRSYIEMLRVEDRLRSHKFYSRAAKSAVSAYLSLFDGPQQTLFAKDGTDLSMLSESERKKALRKARKAELKGQDTAAAETADATASGSPTASGAAAAGGKKKAAPVDPDPEGKKLVEGVDYLAEAAKFVKPLQELSPSDIDGWLLGFEVYIRKNKYLLALQSLKRASQLNATRPEVFRSTVKLGLALVEQAGKTGAEALHPLVLTVLREGVEGLVGAAIAGVQSLKTLHASFVKNNSQSAPHRLVAAETLLLLEPANKAGAIKLVGDIGTTAKTGFSIETAVSTYAFVQRSIKDTGAASAFKSVAAKAFPLATLFQSS
ncbi:NMDA receptor-regulated protein 1-domain-containing protein [Entophlyctis helioformis]|nr:NMDA receptor-regulated protein 1-domain-containing protein [Entophlyctis helioformis]